MKNKLIIRVIAIIALCAFLALSLITSLPLYANAQSAQQRLESAGKQKQELQGKINQTKADINKNLAKKQVIDKEISTVQAKIDKLNGNIEKSNQKIAEKQAELQIAEENSKKQYDSYLTRAKMMVERGSVTYLEVLLNAESFSDLISRIAVVKQIVKYDSNRLEELKKAEQEVKAVKEELEKEKAELVSLKENEDKQRQALEKKRAESQSIIDSLKNDQSEYEKAFEKAEQIQAQARSEIAAAAAAAEAARLRGAAQSGGSSYSTHSAVAAKGRFMWPTPSCTIITSPYYMRVHPVTGKLKQHTGLDIGASHGSSIVAADSGTVIVAGYNAGGYGNYVVVSHGDGYSTLYAHCSALNVSKGQYVQKGQTIAKVGSTGMSTGPHLHFEILINGQHTNPAAYFN